MGIRPIPMKFDNIRVLQLGEIFKHKLYLFLLCFEVLSFRKLHLIPNNFHSLFRVHCQICAVDSRYITLFHLNCDKLYYLRTYNTDLLDKFKPITQTQKKLLIYLQTWFISTACIYMYIDNYLQWYKNYTGQRYDRAINIFWRIYEYKGWRSTLL